MKCIIKGKEVEAKIVENLGYQGGRYAKVVEYNGEEHIVTKIGMKWMQHVPSLQIGHGYMGLSCNDDI